MILCKRFFILLVAAVATPWLFALGAAAAPSNLDELLEQTKNVRAIQSRANAEREREFIAQRNQQAKLLQDAQKARDAADARSQAVSAEYDRNDLRIQELESLLNARMGSLGELFGVVRQFSGDASGIVYQSLVSAQYPGRDEFFTNIAKAKELPSIVQLEQLWYEMLREITASGEVARFKAPVVSTDGERTETPVVRVGPFIAMMEGQYLTYKPDVKVLSVLPRQPPSWLLERADEVTSATTGYVSSAIDPSRGVLLSLYVERPNWVERVQHGEMVNYVILFVGLAGSVCGIFQFFYLLRVRFAVNRQLGSLDKPKGDNPLGRVLATFRGDASTAEEEAEVIELRISEAVLREVPLLERFQPFLRLAVAAGPLLGLVGTVVGMIITFQSITESGQSDPRLMAHGIGTAMIATVLGLGIAIPLLFVNALLASMSRGVVQTLDEQSTGLLAEMLEREHSAGGKGGGPRHA